MHTATRILVILRGSICCAALWWSGQFSSSNVPSSQSSDPTLISEIELAGMLANHAALETYSRRPDCFRRVASKIRLRCGELETNEDERVKAAISMTLCELATATHHSFPLECVSFAADSEVPCSQIQGECVDALSRSAQFWSSYSGYLREIPQLCFAFRRWNDIDTAKEIYKNSTLETMALINLLLTREKADFDERKHWSAQLSEMEEVAIRLNTVSSVLDSLITTAAPRLQSEMIMVVDAFKTGLADIQKNTRSENSQITDLVDSQLQLLSQRHASSLDGLIRSFEAYLGNNLNKTLSVFSNQAVQILDLVATVEERWNNSTFQLSVMEQKISDLSRDAFDTATALETSAQQARTILDAQTAMSLSAAILAETVDQMIITTHDSLESFNASANQLTQRFLPRSSFIEFIAFIEAVLPVDRTFATYLYNLPLFPVASMCFSFLYNLLRSSLSALMSIALVIFSSRKFKIQPLYDQDPILNEISINNAPYHEPALLPSRPTATPVSAFKGSGIISRPGIRRSRIPDRLCSTSRHPNPHFGS